MRIYHGCPSPAKIRESRQHGPSHVHGACWTPAKMTPHEWPYFVDNGAFTDSFDPDEWIDLLDEVLEKMPHPPDFVVLPDQYNDAEGTLETHRKYIPEVVNRGFRPAPVLQPGLNETTQIKLYENLGADTLFVGGDNSWKRAHGQQIIDEAHDAGMKVHVGNPGGKDEMVFWAKAGVDSIDTSTIVQNDNWHWIDAIEKVALREGGLKKESHRQAKLVGGSSD